MKSGKAFSSKLLSVLLVLCMVFCMVPGVFADDEAITPYVVKDYAAGDIVILHTNDVHGHDFGGDMTDANIAQLKKDIEAKGADVFLISAGDASQGTPLVNLDKGMSAMTFMNAVGYDFMALGNHEFDWGVDQLKALYKKAAFPLASANTVDSWTGKPLFDTHVVLEASNGTKIGFFALTTPETATKAHPDNIKGITFQAGQTMFDTAKAQIEALKAEGATLIVCVGHLGNDAESKGNTSEELIAAVPGIDLFIDGHDHVAYPAGKTVGSTLLVSTGEYLSNIGLVTYKAGAFTSELIEAGAYTAEDATIKSLLEVRNDAVEAELSKVFGSTAVDLNGERSPGVRTMETNLGDFATDAFVWAAKNLMGDSEVVGAFTNGGGIRASIAKGDISMKTMNTVFPFGNKLTIVEVTGKQLLEALEAACFMAPEAAGAFPQVSGISFTIDANVAYVNGPVYSGTTYYSPKNPGTRIKDLKVGGVAVDLTKTYKLATNDFTAAGGDTYGVLKACKTIDSEILMDDALIQYTQQVLKGVIPASYAEPEGRIKYAAATSTFSDVTPSDWYYADVNYASKLGIVNGKTATTFVPKANLTIAEAIKLAACMNELADKGSVSLKNGTVTWYTTYVDYCVDKGIIKEGEYTAFNDMATRAQFAAIFSKALPKEKLAAKNTITAVPDVKADAAYADAVLMLYKAGVLTGSDAAHNFKPDTNIIRGEVAAIITRMMDETARKSF